MGRFTFDVFLKKEPIAILPVNILIRKRATPRIAAEPGEDFLTTVEANSYEEAITVLKDKIRRSGSE